MDDRRTQRTAIIAAVKAGKIRAGRAAAYAKWVAGGGDATDMFRTMPVQLAQRGPLSEHEASTVLQALDQYLPAPAGTVAAAGRLGDLEDDGLYAETFGTDPARVTEHFEARRQAIRDSASAQAASLSDEELYDAIFAPHDQD